MEMEFGAAGLALAAPRLRWIIPEALFPEQRPIGQPVFGIGLHERLQSLVS
jgi:hypothetical protein